MEGVFLPRSWNSIVLAVVIRLTTLSFAEQRCVTFDHDPGWDGHNNRSEAQAIRTIVQDFGYSATNHQGGTPGEVGGVVSPDGTL
jgi:hypothetical protein